MSKQELRLGWPDTECETGPEPKMVERSPAKWPAAISRGGVPKWPKNGRAKGRIGRKSLNFGGPAIFPAILRPFWEDREMAADHFAGDSSASFGSGPVSHSVAGQPSLNS